MVAHNSPSVQIEIDAIGFHHAVLLPSPVNCLQSNQRCKEIGSFQSLSLFVVLLVVCLFVCC